MSPADIAYYSLQARQDAAYPVGTIIIKAVSQERGSMNQMMLSGYCQQELSDRFLNKEQRSRRFTTAVVRFKPRYSRIDRNALRGLTNYGSTQRTIMLIFQNQRASKRPTGLVQDKSMVLIMPIIP